MKIVNNNFINSLIYLLDIFIYKFKITNLLSKTQYNKYAMFYNNIFIKHYDNNYFKLFNIYTVKVTEYMLCLS